MCSAAALLLQTVQGKSGGKCQVCVCMCVLSAYYSAAALCISGSEINRTDSRKGREGGEIKRWVIGEAPTRSSTWHHSAGCSLAARLAARRCRTVSLNRTARTAGEIGAQGLGPTLKPASNYAARRLFFINIWWNVICCTEVLRGGGGWERAAAVSLHTHTH